MNTIRLFIFVAIFSVVSCYNEDEYSVLNIDPDSVIVLIEAEKDTLKANNLDKSKIKVQLPIEADDSLSTVHFETTKGLFLTSGKNKTQAIAKLIKESGELKRVASVTLVSGLDTGKVSIAVTVSEIEKKIDLHFIRNPADSLIIVPSSLVIESKPTSELTLTTNLISSIGSVSLGQVVNMSVMDQDSTERGSFRVFNNLSDSLGECKFVYSLVPDTSITGNLIFSATTIGHGDSLIATKTILVIN